jgi:hypothetical protein
MEQQHSPHLVYGTAQSLDVIGNHHHLLPLSSAAAHAIQTHPILGMLLKAATEAKHGLVQHILAPLLSAQCKVRSLAGPATAIKLATYLMPVSFAVRAIRYSALFAVST